MVMSRDHRGMAVLMDAVLFLTALSVLCAVLALPGGTSAPEEKDDLVRSFHTVMLGGEVHGGDGSALSRLSLSSFLVLVSQDNVLTITELEKIRSAVNGTLTELGHMDEMAWWVLEVNGQEHVFGRPCSDGTISLFADRRVLSEDGSVFCTLTIAR